MRRPFVVLLLLLVPLFVTQAASTAVKEFGGAVNVSPAGAGQFVATIQNADIDAPLNAFVFVPGPRLNVTAVVRSDAGTCVPSGATFTCSGLVLAQAECTCVLGGTVNVTFTGSGEGSGSSIAQIGTAAANAAIARAAAATTPAATPTVQATATKAKTTGPPSLVVLAPKTLVVATRNPMLTLTIKLGQAATLSVKLLDTNGRALAQWTKRVPANTSKLELPLPKKARHAGRDTIRVTTTGANPAPPKTLSILLRA